MPDLHGTETTVLIAGGAIIVVLCIAVAILAKKRRNVVKHSHSAMAVNPFRSPLRVKKIPVNMPREAPDTDDDADPRSRPKGLDCITGRANLSESLAALAEKYSLDELTLATADGLLLASSRTSPSADAVARYAGMFAENVQPRPPGITLFGLEHKGSFLVGIAKAGALPVQEADPELVSDTKDILNRWI